MFSTYYFLFKIETNTATQEDEQKNAIDEEIQAEMKGFFFKKKNFNAKSEQDKF